LTQFIENVATNSMVIATGFKNGSSAASRYLMVRNEGGSAFTNHSKRFSTRATYFQH
jgi:hypothetical protein